MRIYGSPKVEHLTSQALREHLSTVLDQSFGELKITVKDGTDADRRNFAVEVAQQFPVALVAASDKLGEDARYAKQLLDALDRNDRSRSRLAPAATVAGSGAVAAGALLTTQLALQGINFNEIAPIVGIWSVVVTIIVGLLTWHRRSTVDTTAMPFLSESVLDWVLNLALTPDVDRRNSLVVDLEGRLLPRAERAAPRLAAALYRVDDLLRDEANQRPAYDPVRLEDALDILMALIGRERVRPPER